MTTALRACVCPATTGLRPYPCGWRCPLHTPAALAGEPEPDQITATARALRAATARQEA